jgi:hypothetical protein
LKDLIEYSDQRPKEKGCEVNASIGDVMLERFEEKKSEKAVFEKMDGFLWAFPKLEGEEYVNGSDSNQPEIVGQGANF